MPTVDLVNVFTHDGAGGNPCPIVVDAAAMSDDAMQAVARDHGHESGFVCPPDRPGVDHALRFWVPNHEMEMCGHATIGALWVMAAKGMLDASEVRIATGSGILTGFVSEGADGAPAVAITQPAGRAVALDGDDRAAVLDALGIGPGDLLDRPVQNAVTARIKTLVPLKDADRLNRLTPDPAAVEAACGAVGSTGLYPYAVVDGPGRTFEARQFPRASGYPEDAATGIAATALAFGLLTNGLVAASDDPITVFQGRAMGCLSRIGVRFGLAGERVVGCLLGGAVVRAEGGPS